ncbi:MAG: hypothetical protein QM504_10885 [Pseudomonadota bacterium]
MIQIKINGEWVETYPGTSLKYVFNSAAFSDKAIVGDFSYSLSFPDSDNNALIFGFISNPDLYNHTSQHNCELYEQNNLMVSGVFKITKAVKGDKISGNFINSAYDFKGQIENMTTKDLDLGGDHEFLIQSEFDAYILAMMNGSYPDYKFAQFPVLNETYLDGTPEEDNWQSILYINPYNPGGNDVYYPYLAYIIEQLFAKFGYNISSNTIAEHLELKKLCLIGLLEDTHVVEYTGYNLHYHVLKVDLNKLLESIKSTLGISFFFSHKSKGVSMGFLKDLLVSGNYVDWTDKIIGKLSKVVDSNDTGYVLSHSFDSTDTTISEMQLPDGIFDNAVIETAVLLPADLPDYANMGIHAGEIRKVICEDMYYIIVDIDPEPTLDHQWTKLTWNFFGKVVGDALNEKQSLLTTLGMNWHSKKLGGDSYRNGWMTPHSDQVLLTKPVTGTLGMLVPGNQNYGLAEALVNDFEPRVLFFRNMRPDAVDVDYPLGTSGKYDAKGNLIGTLTLNWDGADGLYINFWKDWLKFIDEGIPMEASVNLDLLDILKLDTRKQIKIGNNFYLLKKLTIDYPIEKAATAEIVRV